MSPAYAGVTLHRLTRPLIRRHVPRVRGGDPWVPWLVAGVARDDLRRYEAWRANIE